MVERTIYVRVTRARLRQIIAGIPALMRQGGVADAILTRTGMALLGRIRTAFVTKARGGTDEAGDRWAPLSPATIAYRRRHPGLPPARQRAKYRPSYALTKLQRDRWWDNYRQGLAIFDGDKASAARRAWADAKRRGAVTLFDKYGNTSVEILRDTGLLLNSLSPGLSAPHQVLRVGSGVLHMGTNRKGAIAHHHGIPGRLPQRRLWPEPRNWPQRWWDDALEQLREGVIDLIVETVRRG